MIQPPRYYAAKRLIEIGEIKLLNEIYLQIPKSTIAKELGTNYNRLARLVYEPEDFKLRELFHIATILEVPEMRLLELACNQYLEFKAASRLTETLETDKEEKIF